MYDIYIWRSFWMEIFMLYRRCFRLILVCSGLLWDIYIAYTGSYMGTKLA